MWLPTPVYEALPYLYGVLAILIAAVFESSIALASAVLFAVAGLLVWRMRKSYRTDDEEFHVV